MMKKYVILVLISVVSYSSAKSVVQTSCPFVEGLAVYKARALWALWEPSAVFDDRGLCAQGQNKNQDNNNIDEFILNSLKELTSTKRINSSLIESQNKINALEKLIDHSATIQVYPNPANAQVTVENISRVDGKFILYNSIGEIVLKTTLSKENTKTQLAINNITNGMYHYEINFADKEKVIGKLSILK